MFFKPKKKDRVFLDYASTTPVAKEVLAVMHKHAPLFQNPSALYEEARYAKELVGKARASIADFLGVTAKEILCMSGGTEGNNLLLLGIFEQARRNGILTPHIITTKIEHPSVLEVCREIARRGGEVTYVPVSREGLVSPRDISDALTGHTVLVSVMYANNEIGTIQPLHDIAKVIKKFREKKVTEGQSKNIYPYFHTDASQAVLYEEMNVHKLGVDMLVCDGIKMYGPRGIGVVYIKHGIELRPIFFGGGQEKGLRSGTENVSSILGLAEAFRLVQVHRDAEKKRLTLLRDFCISEIRAHFLDARLNGSQEERLPNNINICFPGMDSEFLVVALDVEGIAVSYSSSCRTLAEDSSSYVIEALASETEDPKQCSVSSLRVTLGRESTHKDIHRLVSALRKVILLV